MRLFRNALVRNQRLFEKFDEQVAKKERNAATRHTLRSRKKSGVSSHRMLRRSEREKFLVSPEWLAVREQALELYGRVCLKCGSEHQIQVDHVKPRFRYPELALDVTNLQVLCWPCNKAKGYHDETDYRTGFQLKVTKWNQLLFSRSRLTVPAPVSPLRVRLRITATPRLRSTRKVRTAK